MSVSVGFCFVAAFCLNFCFADPAKATTTPKPPAATKSTNPFFDGMMINWKALDTVDYLRSGALIVGFLALLWSDRRSKTNVRGRRPNNWVNAEIVVFFVGGLIFYFFPTNFLSYIATTKLNVMHEFELQYAGAVLISTAVFTARIQSTLESDGHTHAYWVASRLLLSLFLVMSGLISYYTLGCFTEQFLVSVVLLDVLWLLGCLYQVASVSLVGPGGQMFAGSAAGTNRWLLAETVFIFTMCVPSVALPEAVYTQYTTLVSPDALNLVISQTPPILMIMFAVQAMGLVFNDNVGVKKQWFYSRFVMMALVVPLTMLHQWKAGIMNDQGAKFTAVSHILLAIVYYKGYTAEDKAKTY